MRSDSPHWHFLKPRSLLLLLVGACGYLAFVMTNPLLLALAAGALGLFVHGALEARGLFRHVQATRRHLPRAFEEQTIPLDLRLAVSGGTMSLMTVEDYFPPASASRLRALVVGPVRPGQTLSLGFRATCDHRRGPYVLGPLKLAGSDSLGLFRREHLFELFSRLLVYPTSVDLQEADLLGEGILRHVGMDMSARQGFGEEFVGLRHFRPGDSPRAIHWRSVARHGELMVKEFQEEVTTRVSIFLDLGREGLVGLGDQTSVEYGIKAAASIAKRATARTHQIELFAIGAAVEHLPPGSGTGHLLALLDRLAILKAEANSGFPAVVLDLARSIPPGATAVMILSATASTVERLAPIVDAFRALRVLPVFVLIDDRAFIKLFREQEDRHHKAPPIDAIASELAMRGAMVRTIRKAKTISQALVQGLERAHAASSR